MRYPTCSFQLISSIQQQNQLDTVRYWWTLTVQAMIKGFVSSVLPLEICIIIKTIKNYLFYKFHTEIFHKNFQGIFNLKTHS